MNNNGYRYVGPCSGTMKENEENHNCNVLKMNTSLLMANSNTPKSADAASLTKQLFSRATDSTKSSIIAEDDYEDDLKYGIKVFINNNTITANHSNSTTISSNSIASDEDDDDDDDDDVEDDDDDDFDDDDDEVDDNDSGIVTSTTSAGTADQVDTSASDCHEVTTSLASGSDNNDDDKNYDDDNTSTTATTSGIISSNSSNCSSTAIATTCKSHLHNNHKRSRKLRFGVGQDVLARWNDGLFYLGNILKIDEKIGKCFVQFEDNSEFWVMFKDIQRGAKEGEIMCCSCQGESSDVPDEIVLCDNCGLGYHQLCHNPPIDTNVLNPDVEWLCRLCVFASTVKRGGALKSGPNAQALQLMKQSLPYDMNLLTWDAQHKTNLEQSYCYCGGPGDWYMKMLQCCRCRMWFHEACIQCLDQPLLYGDRFYLFVCSFCNSGPEYLKRIQLKWADIAQLALFSLCISYQKKYYDLDKVIIPWIYMNRENLQLDSHLETHLRNEVKEKILETLRSHKKRFQCGREIKKSRSLWGLRLRLPPSPPTIDLPIEGQITDEVMSNIQMKGRKTKTFVPVECQSPIRLKRKASTVDGEDSLLKTKKHAVNGTKVSYGKRNGVTHCTLDSIIPPLPSFEGLNHPFKTDLEQKIESEKQKLKENILTLYQNGFDPAEHFTKELKSASRNLPPKPPQKQKGRRKAGSVKLKPPAPATTKTNTVSKTDAETLLSNTDSDPSTEDSLKQLKSSVSDYISVVNRLAKREMFHVLARRHVPEGQVQYLVQWEGMLS